MQPYSRSSAGSYSFSSSASSSSSGSVSSGIASKTNTEKTYTDKSFSNMNFKNVDLSGFLFRNCVFESSDFTGAKLRDTTIIAKLDDETLKTLNFGFLERLPDGEKTVTRGEFSLSLPADGSVGTHVIALFN